MAGDDLDTASSVGGGGDLDALLLALLLRRELPFSFFVDRFSSRLSERDRDLGAFFLVLFPFFTGGGELDALLLLALWRLLESFPISIGIFLSRLSDRDRDLDENEELLSEDEL